MTAQLFLTYLVFVVVAVIGISAAYLPRLMIFGIIAGLAIWLVYVGLFSSLGYMRDASLRPPGILWGVGPVVLFVVFVVRSNIGACVAAAIPLWLILCFDSLRTCAAPLSAPIIAWIATTGRPGLRLAMGWNVLGLLSLANVTASAVLTGPLKLISTEVPTAAMGFFPYPFIAGCLAPLAVTFHVLAIRAIAARLRDTRSAASGISASTS